MLFELSETLLCRATPSMRLSTTLFGSRTTAKVVLIIKMIRQSKNHDSQTVPVSGILLQPLKQRTIASEDRTNERVQRGEGERDSGFLHRPVTAIFYSLVTGPATGLLEGACSGPVERNPAPFRIPPLPSLLKC